jgi:dGTPase
MGHTAHIGGDPGHDAIRMVEHFSTGGTRSGPLRLGVASSGDDGAMTELSSRARAWASTMEGFDDETPTRLAHRESGPSLGPVAPLLRPEREALEELQLCPGATRAVGAGHRILAEEPDPVRTCFERDRDRILHGSTAFRRLAGKTQVFVFPDDHQRTRLTHALEVAQVATAIARALRLNVALTEAIALGHDCGHGPGGHASEDAFSPYLADGYDHAVWGADVVLSPLNLCVDTLDGIRNHSWSRPAPSTPEGEVVSWADRIAYVCHDFEDAERAGVVSSEALPMIVRERCGERRSSWLRAFIDGVVEGTAVAGHVAMTTPLAEALGAFRATNYEQIYLRPDSLGQGRAVVAVLQGLVEHYAERPDRLPPTRVDELDQPGTPSALRASITYVAGMTDRYACRMAVEELDWPADQLPRGLDGRTG